MNGKKAKLLRRAQGDRRRLTESDRQILQASLERQRAHLARGPKPLPERRRKRQAARRPTWPRSKDQRAQSRPLIVLRPLRALGLALLASNPRNDDGARHLTWLQARQLDAMQHLPKHLIDTEALRA